MFDNTRPFKSSFSSKDALADALRMLRVSGLDITEVTNDNAEEMLSTAEETGNMSQKPSLMKFCRNPHFKYILGRDEKTGRSPVKIRW